MTKKKTKKSSSKKRTVRSGRSRKQVDAAKVREQIAGIVRSGAKEITEAVMDQAIHGELAPAKYLFEMAGVYPPSTDGSVASAEEDCLAKTLLDRLNIPDKPVVADQDEDEEIVINPVKQVESGDDAGGFEEKVEQEEVVGV